MTDKNGNGIHDHHELIFLAVRIGILVWSMGMLSVSFFIKNDIDKTFFATTTTAAAASFGIKKQSSSDKETK